MAVVQVAPADQVEYCARIRDASADCVALELQMTRNTEASATERVNLILTCGVQRKRVQQMLINHAKKMVQRTWQIYNDRRSELAEQEEVVAKRQKKSVGEWLLEDDSADAPSDDYVPDIFDHPDPGLVNSVLWEKSGWDKCTCTTRRGKTIPRYMCPVCKAYTTAPLPPAAAPPAAAPSADEWCRHTGYRLDSLLPAQHDYRDYAQAPAASAPAAE